MLYLTMGYGDKLFEVVYAQMYVGGKRLYTDIQPLSLPMIMWIYAVPALLAGIFHMPEAFAMLWAVGLAVILFSVYLSVRLIALHPEFSGRPMRQGWFAMLLLFVVVFRTNPHYYLDREHWFFLLTMPYLLRFLPSLHNKPLPRWLALSIGLLAAIGLCIKPQCCLLLAGVMLLYLLSARKTRLLYAPESLTLYGAGAVYIFSALLLYPDYFHIILPMALATYSVDRDMTPIMYYLASTLTILGFAFLFFRWRASTPYRRDIWYLLGLCPFYFLYVLANNNWAYTYYPLGSMALIVTGFVLAEWIYLLRSDDSRRDWWWYGAYLLALCPFYFLYNYVFEHWGLTELTRPLFIVAALALGQWVYLLRKDKNGFVWFGAAGITACLCTFGYRVYLTITYFSVILAHGCYGPYCEDDRPLIEEMEAQHAHSFGALTIDFTRWAKLVRYTGASWDTRFPSLWMVPKFLQEGEAFTQSHRWIVDYVGNALAEDLNRNRPPIVFVDDTDVFFSVHKPADLVEFFSHVPSFAGSWKQYELIHRIDMCKGRPDYPEYKLKCSYDVYRRKP